MTKLSRRAFLRASALLAACAAAPAGLAACDSSTKTGTGTLKVGVRAMIVGMGEYNEATGKYYGMEIDLTAEMASRMGYADVEYVAVTPDDRKEKLLNGEVDAIAACYSVSDSREANFDFSPAYYTDSIKLMVEKSSLIKSVSDLKGGVIGTRAGANTAPLLLETLKDSGFTDGTVLSANSDNTDVRFDTWHLLEYDGYQELSDALESGEVDAAAMDGVFAHTYANDDREFVEGFSASEQQYAVATQKDSELSAKVASAIQAMLDDGTIDALKNKWN